MAVTSGFFNSLNHDRRYNAFQFGSMFDGLIHDGVYLNIGDHFEIKALEGTSITVGTGRAWFDRSWIFNDSLYTIDCEPSEILLDRWDAIVLDFDNTDMTRLNTIKLIHGAASSDPVKPTLVKTEGHNQYPLGYIYRKSNSEEITQADITNMIGTSDCPFVTGIVQSLNLDLFVRQMQSQWDNWFAKETDENNNQMVQWISEQQTDFTIWFNNLQTVLDGDVAANLAKKVLDLEERFDILAEEKAVYVSIDDNIGDPLIDSFGGELLGRVLFEPKHIFNGDDIYEDVEGEIV